MERVFRSGLHPLDQREFLGNVLTLEFALRHYPAPGLTDPRALVKTMIGLEPSERFGAGYWRRCKALISEFGSQLGALVKDYRAARVKFLSRLKDAPVGLVLVPVWMQSGNTLRLRFAVLADELPGVLRYALSLLLDKEIGAQLCRCTLPECGRFYLAATEPAGGVWPNRAYCSDEHMTLAHNRDTSRGVGRAGKSKPARKRQR
jgi:hypothetical protein